jgi:hypothetical protein
VVITIKQVPLTILPQLMETKAIGIGNGSVGCAMNDAGRTFVASGCLVDRKPEGGLYLFAPQTMAPNLYVLRWIQRIALADRLSGYCPANSIITQHASGS